MRVVIAPDSFGGTLSAGEVANCIAAAWHQVRPGDELVTVPLSDGGEGLVAVLHTSLGGVVRELEVAGPHGKPVSASWLLVGDVAYVEAAEAAGLKQLPQELRSPVRTTTYGVGQLLEAARSTGASRIVVGLGGSATVDAGAGALTALGVRLLREGGNGLKVGGGELHHLQAVDRGWLSPDWASVPVECWADVRTPLLEAATRFGPQKGASPDDVELLHRGLERFADTVERDLGTDPSLRKSDGTGASGGLGYGLVAALGARIVDGAAHVADAVGLERLCEGADVVVTGEGTIDATSFEGKVVGHVHDLAGEIGAQAVAVVGRRAEDVPIRVEEAAPVGPGPDVRGELTAAAMRAARHFT